MLNALATIARRITSSFVFTKRLPMDFGRQKLYVTSRSDIRLLYPGLNKAAGDLFTVVRKYIDKGDVVWDIGSNLGILSFCSAIRVGRTGKVFSIEPAPRYADIQGKSLGAFTSDAGKVTVLCAAVADKVGLLDFVVAKKGHTRSHLASVDGNSAGEPEAIKQVVALTLDWLLDYWPPPNFIKIDIEGAEALAIAGANKLFTTIRPTAYIECAPCNSLYLTRFFKDRNYGLFSINKLGVEQQIESFRFNTLVKPI